MQRRESDKSFAELKDEYALGDPDDAELPVDESDGEAVQDAPQPSQPATPAWKSSALCILLIFISIYESITKKRAMKQAKFDMASLFVMQAVLSIVVGVVLALLNGQVKTLFGNGTFFFVQLLKYTPIGILFTVAACVQMVTLTFLAVDVFKVLEQTRLLLTAVFAFFIFRRKLSISSWVALFAITLVSCSYAFTRQLTTESDTLAETLGFFGESTKDAHGAEENLSPRSLKLFRSRPSKDELSPLELKVLEGVQKALSADTAHNSTFAKNIMKNVIEHDPILNSTNPLVGYMLTVVFVFLSCSAATYAEVVLKHGAHVPFYVQKVYMEIPAGIVAVLMSGVVAPILAKKPFDIAFLGKTMFTEGNMFYGWENGWVSAAFFLICIKSWLSGIICKQLSSLAKQLCSITAVVCLYFVMLMHLCPDPDNAHAKLGSPGSPLFCPSNLSNATTAVAVADLTVLCAVVSYITAQRDKQRKVMYKKQFADVDEERKALLSRSYFP